MPTTSFADFTASVAAIGGRTNSAGSAVADYSAEEARLLAQVFTEGHLTPASAFLVAPQAVPNMSIKIGSGTAKADLYVVEGTVDGQGNYLVRLDAASITVAVPAADSSQARTDKVYLVVRDDTYDAGGLSLPRIGYRQGNLGGADPGPDAAWEAYSLLATISVPALATAIDAAKITDGRLAGALLSSLVTSDAIPETLLNAKGDLVVATAADTAARLAVGTNGQVLTADSAQATGTKWATPASGPVGATAFVATSEATASSVFGDLTTVGPSATVVVGSSGIVIVNMRSFMDAVRGQVTVAASGANTIVANAVNGFELQNIAPSAPVRCTGSVIFYGLNPGSTTFTLKYRNAGSSSTNFADRRIEVLAL